MTAPPMSGRADRQDENSMRQVAVNLESGYPRWIVVFGIYSRQFVAFPRFSVPAGTMAVANYPGALTARMLDIERMVQGHGSGDHSQEDQRS